MTFVTAPEISRALVDGLVLSAVLWVLLVGVLWLNAEIMLNDYPPDIRAKHGPISARSKRQKAWVSLLFLVAVMAIVVWSVRNLRVSGSGEIPFWTAFVHLFIMFMVFNLVDLVLIDWPLVALKPEFAVLTGTEGLAGYDDYWFHVRGFFIGTAGILVVSGIMAAVISAVL
ncbi:MAG TPA: hypothetical protein VF491_10160 [Vicinamibacterales bacterium]|jgi:magnesium-transporting ATPase (P-type)